MDAAQGKGRRAWLVGGLVYAAVFLAGSVVAVALDLAHPAVGVVLFPGVLVYALGGFEHADFWLPYFVVGGTGLAFAVGAVLGEFVGFVRRWRRAR